MDNCRAPFSISYLAETGLPSRSLTLHAFSRGRLACGSAFASAAGSSWPSAQLGRPTIARMLAATTAMVTFFHIMGISCVRAGWHFLLHEYPCSFKAGLWIEIFVSSGPLFKRRLAFNSALNRKCLAERESWLTKGEDP